MVLIRRLPLVLLAAMLSVSALACSASGPTSTGVRTEGQLDGSRSVEYSSIDQLKKDSTLIVVGRGTATSSVERVGTFPFTVRSLQVVTVLKGKPGTDTIKVRQLGNPGEAVDDATTLVRSGDTYLLFLKEFVFSDQKPTGQYVPVGGPSGVYVPGPTAGSWSKTDAQAPRLPATLETSQLTS